MSLTLLPLSRGSSLTSRKEIDSLITKSLEMGLTQDPYSLTFSAILFEDYMILVLINIFPIIL